MEPEVNREELLLKAKVKAELERRKTEEQIRYYTPNSDKHLDFHYSDAKVKFFFAGNRVGKTVAGGIEAVMNSLGRDGMKYYDTFVDTWIEHSKLPKKEAQQKIKHIVERFKDEPPRSGWIASVSYKLQSDGCQEALLKYLPKREIKGISYINKESNIISQINLFNGASIQFKSYEQGAEDFQSAGKGWIWFDEEPPEDIWKESSVRQVAGLPLRRWATMTPVNGLSWVYDQIFLNKFNNPDIFRVQAGWINNPHLSEEQLRSMSYGLTDDELRVRRDGDFAQPFGVVFKSFKPTFHVVAHTEPDRERFTFYRSFDFGFALEHPFVCLFIALDTDGSLYVYDELYLREYGQEDVIEMVQERSKPYKIRASWGDSARPDWIEAFNKNGLPCEKALKDVEAGIAKIQEYLSIHPMTGKSRLTISNKCQNLITEFTKYSYPKVGDGERGKRLPAKRFDDGLDALRYFIFTFTAPLKDTRGTVIKTYDESGRPLYDRTR